MHFPSGVLNLHPFCEAFQILAIKSIWWIGAETMFIDFHKNRTSMGPSGSTCSTRLANGQVLKVTTMHDPYATQAYIVSGGLLVLSLSGLLVFLVLLSLLVVLFLCAKVLQDMQKSFVSLDWQLLRLDSQKSVSLTGKHLYRACIQVTYGLTSGSSNGSVLSFFFFSLVQSGLHWGECKGVALCHMAMISDHDTPFAAPRYVQFRHDETTNYGHKTCDMD